MAAGALTHGVLLAGPESRRIRGATRLTWYAHAFTDAGVQTTIPGSLLYLRDAFDAAQVYLRTAVHSASNVAGFSAALSRSSRLAFWDPPKAAGASRPALRYVLDATNIVAFTPHPYANTVATMISKTDATSLTP